MTFAPASLSNLAAYWKAQGGVNLGIVGNAAHTTGYHLGRDRIYDGAGPGIGDADYSVKTARDKAGLTNAASAIDLGKLDGSYANLRAFSRWLVARCMADPAVRHDIREIIYSPDGSKVQRYSGIDNLIHSGTGNGDSSHLTHTHISYFRDAQARDKTYTFRPFFEVADMPPLTSYIPGQVATVKPTANVRTAPDLSATVIRVVSTPETWTVIGWCKGDVDPEGGSDQWLIRWNGRYEYTAKSNLSAGPALPPEDCTAEVAAATATLNQQLTDEKALNANYADRLLKINGLSAI